jgi:hypothetical protein
MNGGLCRHFDTTLRRLPLVTPDDYAPDTWGENLLPNGMTYSQGVLSMKFLLYGKAG